MDISDFSEDDFKDRDFGEDDLAELAAVLGLSYEIEYNGASAYIENKSCTVAAWVKFKGLKSKRYAVFMTGKNSHTKRFALDVTFMNKKSFGRGCGLSPRDVRRVRDEAAACVVKSVLFGCRVKISNTRHVEVPRSSSVEELKLKMAVAGGSV